MENKKSKKKTKFVWSTSNWITMYTIFYIALIVIYSLPRIAISIAGPEHAHAVAAILKPGCFDSIGSVLTIFGWGLIAMTAGYAGIDRATMAVKSSMMEMGSCDVGDVKKLRKVIYELLAVFLVSIICNYFHEDFTYHNPIFKVLEDGTRELVSEGVDSIYPGINIPLTEIASALVSTATIFVLGNKSVRLTQQVDATKPEQDWADEKEEKVAVEDK